MNLCSNHVSTNMISVIVTGQYVMCPAVRHKWCADSLTHFSVSKKKLMLNQEFLTKPLNLYNGLFTVDDSVMSWNMSGGDMSHFTKLLHVCACSVFLFLHIFLLPLLSAPPVSLTCTCLTGLDVAPPHTDPSYIKSELTLLPDPALCEQMLCIPVVFRPICVGTCAKTTDFTCGGFNSSSHHNRPELLKITTVVVGFQRLDPECSWFKRDPLLTNIWGKVTRAEQ